MEFWSCSTRDPSQALEESSPVSSGVCARLADTENTWQHLWWCDWRVSLALTLRGKAQTNPQLRNVSQFSSPTLCILGRATWKCVPYF